MYVVSNDSWEVVLEPDIAYTVGRGGDGHDADLPLAADPRLHRRCGEVRVGPDAVRVLNSGAWLPLMITDIDGTGDLRVDPGHQLSVPFARFLLTIDLGDQHHHLRFVSEPAERVLLASTEPGSGHATQSLASISRRAGYFKVLVLLCEPRLLDATNDAVPTDQVIASRLNQIGAEPRRVTADIVERRLAYCRERLGLRGPTAGTGTEDRNARRRLASFALNNQIVTLEDLHRLERRPEA